MRDFEDELLRLQAPTGAFHSTVRFSNSNLDDWNGFTTALVLRAVGQKYSFPGWSQARARALGFLQECELSNRPGFFSFWPRKRWPLWAPDLIADADDTAIMASELFRHGYISLQAASSIASTSLLPYRLEESPADHPWIRSGVFMTWLGKVSINPVDCCVNVNVVAFLSQVGLSSEPGYREACAMVRDALTWSAGRRDRLESLCPYYPNPIEFLHAVRSAVRNGAAALHAPLVTLEEYLITVYEHDCEGPLFSSSDRTFVWSSRAVQLARQISSFENS